MGQLSIAGRKCFADHRQIPRPGLRKREPQKVSTYVQRKAAYIHTYIRVLYERSAHLSASRCTFSRSARGNAARALNAGVCDNARRKLIIFHGESGWREKEAGDSFIIGWHLHAVFTLIEV